jgi:hypothetical protein
MSDQRAIGPGAQGSAWVAGVGLLVVYLLTLAPTITWAHHGADGGDLVTAVARGSIPHPPGFPTYLALGELFIRLPWGEPAWRMNLMSAVLAAGAGALTTVAVRVLQSRKQETRGKRAGEQGNRRQGAGSRRQEAREKRQEALNGVGSASPAPISNLHPPSSILHSPFSILLPPLCAGLVLGLAPLLWSQALIAEVYAPAAFFATLVIVLALRGGPASVLGLAWGVGMGAHPTLLFMVPLVAWGAWGDEQGRLRHLVQAGLLALVGWGVMYGPVLLARGQTPSPWADVSTPAGWWALVTGRLYRGYLFGLPLSAWPQRLLAWVGLLARQFTPIGAVLAGLGWAGLWRERRALALASALAFGGFSLYAVGYDTADSLVYLAPALPLAALWLGAGLVWATAWLGSRLRQGVWLILLLPLLQATLFWGQTDLSGDRSAITWAEQLLQQAPPRAVLLTAHDVHTFTLWYVHDILDERQDIVIVDQDLWAHAPYRNVVEEELGLETPESNLSPDGIARWAGRPLIRVNNE